MRGAADGSRRGTLVALAALLALLSACGETRPARRNLLLISLDSVRADFVGAYGARLPHAPDVSPTPNLDALAREGVLYANARSTTSWTLPAHASLFTGVPELVHGVEQDGRCLPTELPTLAETLRARGWRTEGVFSGPYLDPRYGFGRGFERYRAGYGPGLAAAADEVAVATRLAESVDAAREPERARVAAGRLRAAESALEVASHRDVSSEHVTELALDALAAAAGDERPFFLFAHYFDPHYDYAPPEPYARRFDPDYAGTLDARGYVSNEAIAAFDDASPSGRRRTASQRDLEHVEALYAGEIAWTDANVGRLLAELERLELADETLVVVLADHGDEFFEHGGIGHRRTLHEEVLRVPLILRLPGVLPSGERRDRPIALSDVVALLAELLAEPALAPAAPAPPPVARLVLPDPTTGSERVREAFHHGTLVVAREGTVAPEQPRPAAAPRWIDLARHPDAPDAAWSEDFTDVRAAEALAAFRASYAALATRRLTPPPLTADAALLAALRGLGYAGGDASLPPEALLLPLPGP